MTKRLLHFTLGPVQDFIADARRTRDFWSGSFLLSWLAGQAMSALESETRGTIIFPEVAGDKLFQAIQKAPDAGTPFVGSLPNRFKASLQEGEGLPGGEVCKQVVKDAWQKLANKVYEKFIQNAAKSGNGTKEIWDRQILEFWDINWVEGDELDGANDGAWLEQRKNWRTHYPGLSGVEPGDLCRLMGRYQEISGYSGLRSEMKQKNFWETLSKKAGQLNLRPGERLCAIALVKRLFPLLDEATLVEVIGWVPGKEEGVSIVHWPSVSYIAAVPWLKEIERSVESSSQNAYFETVKRNLKPGFMGETSTTIFGFPSNDLFKLDGHLLHQDGVEMWPEDGLKGDTAHEKEKARKEISTALKQVRDKTGGVPASEFYALLLMDGDRIGTLLGDHPNVVKTGLRRFTDRVKAEFQTPNHPEGVLIYAGGDDVFALVAVDGAIDMAKNLRVAYREEFEVAIAENEQDNAQISNFTASTAIVFAQYKIPFRQLVTHAHFFLDRVAKEENGRDSLSVAVVKPGGVGLSWTSVWELGAQQPVSVLDTLAKKMRTEGHVSSSLIYNLKTRVEPLFDQRVGGSSNGIAGAEATPFGSETLLGPLIVAELKSSGAEDKEAREIAAQLLAIGKPLTRISGVPKPIEGFSFDGSVLARFLSIEGRWNLTEGSSE